jgi:NAD(P)-dependent dehydrogenase (short-subunit alcohol dehydrogenase family)
MSILLDNKVVVVTGAGRGIGRAVALGCAAAGAKVVVNDLGVSLSGDTTQEDPAEEVVREIQSAGGEAVASLESVAEWDGAKRIVDCAIDTFGRLDGVVNNAGFLRDSFFHKMSQDDWGAVVQVMLTGSFNVARHAAEVFRAQGSGSFVHMTSNAGLVGNSGQANYVAAKAGIVGLSKAIALDMQRFNVNSNCIAPMGWTRMLEKIPTTDEASKAFVEQRRLVTPDKNVPLTVYLLSDEAKFVSGEVFVTRMNEIILMTQSRVSRSVHAHGGWTPESVGTHAMPALRTSFHGMETISDVFAWDPI